MRTIKSRKNDIKYIFKVTALVNNYIAFSEAKNFHRLKTKEMPWVKVVILGRQNLYKFAESIVYAFEFDFDHCFGFYSNVETDYYHDSKTQYELFADLDDVEPTEAGSVKKTKVAKVWKKAGDKMTFLFDYGDGWRFLAELLEIQPEKEVWAYPVIMEKHGLAPVQYPPEKFFK